MMWSIAWLLLQGAASAQPPAPTPYQVLQAEHARGADLQTLRDGLQHGDTLVQRLAVRAMGRLERAALLPDLMPLLRSPAASVRREVVLASAQMGVAALGWQVVDGPARDTAPEVRAAGFATMGRTAAATGEWEARLAGGLRDASVLVRRGAARGLEAFYRRHRRTLAPADSVLRRLEQQVTRDGDRELALLAALGRLAAQQVQRSPIPTLSTAWVTSLRAHPEAQVRRVAALLLPGTWALRDPSPLVRLEVVRSPLALTPAQLAATLADRDEHVRLVAIDRLAREPQAMDRLRPLLDPLLAPARDWRTRAHAVMALARISADSARPHIAQLMRDTVWQARAWAARGAVVARDSATLRALARDPEPNVRLEAITSPDDALQALEVDHAGLLLAAAEFLTKYEGDTAVARRHAEAGARAFERISRTRSVGWRDPRVALLKLVALRGQAHPPLRGLWMAQWVRDADPEIQRIAMAAVPGWYPVPSAGTGSAAPPSPPPALPYVPPAFAPEAELAALAGAAVDITMRGKGTITLALLADVAPMTVVTFARLAERGEYNGRTLHRVVPNFVVQGGSPGADEYDPATDFFMRDEVGAPNVRGSLGISTRGRDTGDGQFYFNLVDNVRLDFDYTVFAHPVRGLEVMDRIQEGDVIESVVIRRAPTARAVPGDR